MKENPYNHSCILGIVKSQLLINRSSKGLIVFSDVDGTLLPSKQYHGQPEYEELLLASRRVIAELSLRLVPLVPVTGRTLNELRKTLKSHDINRDYESTPFLAHIYSAGNNIQFLNNQGVWEEDTTYASMLGEQQEGLRELVGQFYVNFEEALSSSNININQFIAREGNPQDDGICRVYKFSGCLDDVDTVEKTSYEMTKLFGITNLKYATSETRRLQDGTTEYVHAFQPYDKADAVEYMLKQLNDCLPEDTKVYGVTIGNSGNDLSMIMGSSLFGCIVGDSTEELTMRLARIPQVRKNRFTKYEVSGGYTRLYKGKGIGPFSILEMIEIVSPLLDKLKN